ncbi:MAG: GyrI-like domain-containing protein [Dethiobacteria bacterium]|nr:GyrI-like domain-containing protein [Dethiobacteria bacterium]
MKAKVDFKKENKDLYQPGSKPTVIDVPPMDFIMLDGAGDPTREAYQQAVGVLYALTFTIKMSKMGGNQPVGYFEYVLPPLEGLWWISGGAFSFDQRENWLWTSMIRQPGFVTPAVFDWALDECRRKKPALDLSKARQESFTEGLCVQMMHIGPYADEPRSVDLMKRFMAENDLVDQTGSERKHHEIYLSDPRKMTPEKLKTVLRHPVARIK